MASAEMHVDSQGLDVAASNIRPVMAGRCDDPEGNRVHAHNADTTGTVNQVRNFFP